MGSLCPLHNQGTRRVVGVRGNKIYSRAQGHRNQDLGTAGLGGWLLVPRESLSQPLLSRHDQGSTSPRRWQYSMEQGAVMPSCRSVQ